MKDREKHRMTQTKSISTIGCALLDNDCRCIKLTCDIQFVLFAIGLDNYSTSHRYYQTMPIQDEITALYQQFSTTSNRSRFILSAFILTSFLFVSFTFQPVKFYIRSIVSSRGNGRSFCFTQQSTDTRPSWIYNCGQDKNTLSLLWTHRGTGIMKYVQWIVTRKLGNIKITQLNDDCEVIGESDFPSLSNHTKYVQLYLVSLTMNIDVKSNCSMELARVMESAAGKINQIYFKRRSIEATILYQNLDRRRYTRNLSFGWNDSSLEKTSQGAHSITERLITYLTNSARVKLKIIDSEDLIHLSLVDCERTLGEFIALLGFDTSSPTWRNIVRYDSHQFIQDTTWWDQSETVEFIRTPQQLQNSSNVTYANDFKRLEGRRSFEQYLSDNRQCFNDGIFPQLESETIPHRSSTDQPDRCSSKKFDCAFSDLYSFADREQMYQLHDSSHLFNQKPLKCAFTIPSLLDKVRHRYARNHTCQTVFFTSITHCYDPLPVIQGRIPLHSCFVALLDRETINAYEKFYLTRNKSENVVIQWDIIDLEVNGSLFRVPPKLTETLKTVGHRLFPMAKWIIWLDGKAHVTDLGDLLATTRTPIMGPYHPESRTPDSEVEPTVLHMAHRSVGHLEHLRTTIHEIELQQAEYRRDGFYSRAAALGLRIFDIAALIYRNNHPCVARYLCGWHNEVNYYSFRGQLSVYYSAVRLNLTDYLSFMPAQSFFGVHHQPVCQASLKSNQ